MPLSPDGGRSRLALRVTPGAARNAIGPIAADAAGSRFLKVSVTAPPDGGKANAAVIRLLSKTWRLPKGAFEIAAGHKDRRKTLLIDAPPETIQAAIRAHLPADPPD